ncbi:hypothetical protein K1719_024286 [Acacia pycnantha]|nr:hypothetical protein K1719_024286 [Acacia pycnantha]
MEEVTRRRKKSKFRTHASGPSQSAPCDSTEQVGPEKLSRRGKIHKCTRCKKEGHNRSTCKEPPTANEARNRRKGRRKSSQTPQQPPDPVNAQPSQQPPQQTRTC